MFLGCACTSISSPICAIASRPSRSFASRERGWRRRARERGRAASARGGRGGSQAACAREGQWREGGWVVVGGWDYGGLADNEHTQAVMRALAMAKSILFVGFGAGLRDPNFNQFLRWSRRVSRTLPYRHYRLVRASEAARVRRDHDPDERIMVLSYGAEPPA